MSAQRRQRVGPYDYRLAYFAGLVAARDGKGIASCPHYGKERTEWARGYRAARKIMEEAQ